jgi:hypothetical protein
MVTLSEAGCIVFRNNVGNFWQGTLIHKAGDQVTLKSARMIPCGLQVGSSDIIGIAPNGKFLAVEIKTEKGRPTKEQLKFINNVNKAGGIAGVCRSPEDAITLLRRG